MIGMNAPPGKRYHRLIVASSLTAAVIVGWLDYMTGPYLNLELIYLLPIVIASWFYSCRYGLFLASICTIFLLTADISWKSPALDIPVVVLNALFRLVIFVFIVQGIARIKKDALIIRQEAEREKNYARTDSLTGIANARYFYEVLNVEMERSRRHQHPLTVLYIDLDNFKTINDRHGHLAGDRLLRSIADLIGQNIREIDTVARLGGDEFGILMPETTVKTARPVVVRLRKILRLELQKMNRKITLSIGIGTFRKIPDSADVIITRVDGLMYNAKRKGKNRVEERTYDN